MHNDTLTQRHITAITSNIRSVRNSLSYSVIYSMLTTP